MSITSDLKAMQNSTFAIISPMFTLQKAHVDEAQEIRELLGETWNDAYSHVYTPTQINAIRSQWHTLELLSGQIQDPNILFIVAKEDDKIVGMCNASLEMEGLVNIQRLHVLPSHQRKGLGSQLLNEIIRLSPEVHTFQLEVEKQNEKAYKFYERHDFKKVGEKVFEVAGVEMPCFVMEKKV